MRTPTWMFLLAMTACRGKVDDTSEETGIDTSDTSTDADSDGYTADVDCDDSDPTINPAATEACDGIDQDCDDVVDEALAQNTFYLDSDGDGYGDGDVTIQACAAPPGYAAVAGDCNDADPNVKSGVELCDGLPNGCDTTGWDPALENGHVTFFPSSGNPVDLTGTLTGADFAPGNWTAPSDGTVKFCSNTVPYYGQIHNGGHNLVIDGVDRAVTTLSGGHAGRALEVTGGAVTVEDVTIRDGFTSTPGGNVACTGGSLTLTRVHVTGALSTAQGGGLYFASCPAVLTDVQVDNNAAVQGGGIWFSSNQTWTNVTVDQNDASTGGAGVYGTTGSLTATNSSVTANDAGDSDGGGLALSALTASFSNVSIRDDRARKGGGAYLTDVDLTMSGGEFRNNRSGDTGAHIELRTASTLSGSNVTFRDAESNNGGPIAILDGSTVTLNSGEIRDNNGDRTGGLWVDSGTATFFSVSFRNNDPNDAYANGQGYDYFQSTTGSCNSSTGCIP